MDAALLIPALSGATLGGGLTYISTRRLQRAKPRMSVLGCELTSEFAPESVTVEPDHGLVVAIHRAPEVGSEWIDTYDEVGEGEYVSWLKATRAEIDLFKRRQPQFAEVVRQLRDLADTSRWDEFRALWIDENGMLWAPLITAFSRGEIADLESPTEFDVPMMSLREREEALWLYIKDRGIWFSYDADDASQAEFTKKSATAIATDHGEDVRKLLNHLSHYSATAHYDELLSKIDGEVQAYSRLVVSGHLTNTGRLPCSVANHSRLFLKAAGKAIAQLPVSAAGHSAAPAAYEKDVSIEMLIVDNSGDDLDFKAPLVIPAGGHVPFIAQSQDLFAKLPLSHDLGKKLEAGGVKAYMTYQVALPGANKQRCRNTKDFDFIIARRAPKMRGKVTRRRKTDSPT